MIEIRTNFIDNLSPLEFEIPYLRPTIIALGILTLIALYYYDTKAMRSYYG
jgi:hypothetical protein